MIEIDGKQVTSLVEADEYERLRLRLLNGRSPMGKLLVAPAVSNISLRFYPADKGAASQQQ